MSEKKLNIYQKISLVMQDVSYLQKDDNIQFASTKYKAISEEKVTSTIRESLIKHGLVILPFEQEHFREGTLSTVNTKYKIVDTDSGEYEVIVSSGTGVDTQDKGVGKAMTYSYKYLLLRTFAIPTGEDPDKVSNAEIEHKQNNPKPQQQQPQRQTQNNNNGPKKISPNQLKLLQTLISKVQKAYSMEAQEVKAMLEKTDGVGSFASSKDLTIGQASAAIKALQTQLGEG